MTKSNLNAHKLFSDAPQQNHLLAKLNVAAADDRALRTARDDIRQAIRAGFSAWENFVEKRTLLDPSIVRKADTLPALRPKFRMQGSAAYHTLNDPAHKPPQQIDYDDGVFLPVSFIVGTRDPMVSSAGYFLLVETILGPLVAYKGWKLLTYKSSCVRVQISPNAHIDLPLYAIADVEFHRLVEKAAMAVDRRAELRDSIALDEALYAGVAEGNIRLAHRTKGWIDSDPRAVEDWFMGALRTHGEQLRRVCRYLKSWRDHNWPEYVLSSITLMKCVVDIYDGLGGSLDDKRDDYAILEIARQLPALLEGPIAHPVVDEYLDAEWQPQLRHSYISGANALLARMETALFATDSPHVALVEITSAFGSRIPQDANLITPTALPARVASYQREKVAAPLVPKTTSG
jgi:hypothetical protein